MKDNYTHIVVLIDRSGSMAGNWSDVVGGYKSTIQEQKREPGECTLTTVAFDDSYEVVEKFTPIKNASEELSVSPRGMTALLDAIGKTINGVGEDLRKMDEKDRPSKVLFIVQTDGLENSSKEFDKKTVKSMVEKQKDEYNWNFMFLGASLDSVNQAKSYGFGASSTAHYSTDKYNETIDLMSKKMTSVRAGAECSFSEDERDMLK